MPPSFLGGIVKDINDDVLFGLVQLYVALPTANDEVSFRSVHFRTSEDKEWNEQKGKSAHRE